MKIFKLIQWFIDELICRVVTRINELPNYRINM